MSDRILHLSKMLLLVAILLPIGLGYGMGDVMTKERRTREYFKDPKVIELIFAAAKGDIKKIDLLVKQGVNVNVRGNGNTTPLLLSLQSKNIAGFKRLLEHGADPNIIVEERHSVMQILAGGDSPEFLKEALEHGGDPNLADPYNNEPLLFMSIFQRRKDNIRLLIDARADLNFQKAPGITPLFTAAGQMQYDIVFELLRAGADFRIRDQNGRNTLLWPIENNNIDPKSEQYKWRSKVIEFLQARGVEVNPRIP